MKSKAENRVPHARQPDVSRHWTRRFPLIGPLALARPRWSIAVALGGAAYLLLHDLPGPIRLIAAWNIACLFFLIASGIMAFHESPDQVRRRAQLMDQGAIAVLLLTLVGAGTSLFTVINGSKAVSTFANGSKGTAAALVGITLLLTWMTTHVSFALHYAHLYYGDSETDANQHAGGLDFPGKEAPDYLDFAYFSFVVGMTFQVSDVQITDRGLRRLALLQGMIAFLFSTVILALAINVLADLVH